MSCDHSPSGNRLEIQNEEYTLGIAAANTQNDPPSDNGGGGVEQRQMATNRQNQLLSNIFSQNLDTIIIKLIASPHCSQW